MYVDSHGQVATGVRQWLPNAAAAAALPWHHIETGRAATRTEIEDAFRQVQAQGSGRMALAYRMASNLVLPAGVAGGLLLTRIQREVLPALRRLFRGFDRYPLPARRALVEMGFDLGAAPLSKFRNLIAACERGDFAMAAEHCRRRRRGDARNAATHALFVDAERYRNVGS